MNFGSVDREVIDDRRKPEQRLPRDFDVESADIDEWLGLAAAADVKVPDIEAKAIGIERDPADSNRAMKRLCDLSGQHAAQNRRNAEKTEQTIEDD
jgi:hypothetical protein